MQNDKPANLSIAPLEPLGQPCTRTKTHRYHQLLADCVRTLLSPSKEPVFELTLNALLCYGFGDDLGGMNGSACSMASAPA
jgi:hypothetical protein